MHVVIAYLTSTCSQSSEMGSTSYGREGFDSKAEWAKSGFPALNKGRRLEEIGYQLDRQAGQHSLVGNSH